MAIDLEARAAAAPAAATFARRLVAWDSLRWFLLAAFLAKIGLATASARGAIASAASSAAAGNATATATASAPAAGGPGAPVAPVEAGGGERHASVARQSASAGAGAAVARQTAPVEAQAALPGPATTAEAAGTQARGFATHGERPRAGDVHTLLAAIAERQAQLDERTRELDAREERLQLYETDVTRKLAQLEAIEKRLAESASASASGSDQAVASLAKVYGTMQPAQAAAILEQLDDPTVLRILGRMKEKEIGQILPLMTRERAIVLTRSLVAAR